MNDAWFVRYQPNRAALARVYLFPYAGGGANAFRSWANKLGPDVELVAIQLPGRESRIREAPMCSIEQIADLLAAIWPGADTRPSAFFGHSMGSLISFELARRLHAQQHPAAPQLFVASGHRAPQTARMSKQFSKMEDKLLIEELRGLGGTPSAVLDNFELMELLLPTIRADFAACEEYTHLPGEPMPCPIHVFCGTDDPHAPLGLMAEWEMQTTGEFSVTPFTGGHFFLHDNTSEVQAALADLVEIHLIAAS